MHLSFRKSTLLLTTVGLFFLAMIGLAMGDSGKSKPISGTIYGAFDYQVGAWVGHALIDLGNGSPSAASFVDVNTSFDMRKNGAIEGTEVITFTFLDGSGTFEIEGRFTGTPGATPNLFTLHEVGTIRNGTGDYWNLSGHVSIQGPFLLPDPSQTPGAPPWIAEMHGATSGL